MKEISRLCETRMHARRENILNQHFISMYSIEVRSGASYSETHDRHADTGC